MKWPSWKQHDQNAFHDRPLESRLAGVDQRLLAHGITVLIDVRSRPRALRRVQSGHIDSPAGRHRDRVSALAPLEGKLQRPLSRVKRELERLVADAGEHRLYLMCSEGDYRDCHRHTLLTSIALELGWTVL